MDKLLLKRKRKSVWVLPIAGALIAVAIALVVLVRTGEASTATATEVVAIGERTRTISGRATLTPTRISAVAADVDGIVVELLASPGDTVRRGQAIAKLTNNRVFTDLRRAELAHRNAQAVSKIAAAELNEKLLDRKISVGVAQRGLDTADAELRAYQMLYEKGGVSRISLDKVKMSHSEAEANLDYALQKLAEFQASVPARTLEANSDVETARQELEQARGNVKALTLSAPNEGVLSKLSLAVGQRLAAGAIAGEIVSKELQVDIEISQDEASGITIGQPVALHAPRGTLQARIVAVLPRATDGAVHAKAVLLTSAPWARADSVCEARISDESPTKGLFVKSPIGVVANSTATVLVERPDGSQRKTLVRFGDRFQDELLVLDGLSAGDRIISSVD